MAVKMIELKKVTISLIVVDGMSMTISSGTIGESIVAYKHGIIASFKYSKYSKLYIFLKIIRFAI